MRFEGLPLDGAFSVVPEPHEDERGSFARIWSADDYAAQGLVTHVAESSLSHNPHRGTLRGLHYQVPPHEEAKVIACVRGAMWDVILDLRADSQTYRQWHGIELNADRLRALYVPPGIAHGFLTLSDDVLILYAISEPYEPAGARGVRWDDPAFGIDWPAVPTIVGSRDRSFPDFEGGVADD